MGAIRILSTRKLQPNHKQFLLNAGLAVVEADFISIKLKPFETGNIEANLIFTSTNAFKSFLMHRESVNYKEHRIFCVGQSTTQYIEQHGYEVEATADYAVELAEIITNGYRDERFTFFSGNLRRDTLPDALSKAEVVFNEIEVYETILTPSEIKAELNGIMFYSPSGVESFLKENEITNQMCFCIGTTTADALNEITENIVIANKPTVENLIIQCINYYKT
jgi:uroporphyrinogen-III synthase